MGSKYFWVSENEIMNKDMKYSFFVYFFNGKFENQHWSHWKRPNKLKATSAVFLKLRKFAKNMSQNFFRWVIKESGINF